VTEHFNLHTGNKLRRSSFLMATIKGKAAMKFGAIKSRWFLSLPELALAEATCCPEVRAGVAK
jgi:hypothetical protein